MEMARPRHPKIRCANTGTHEAFPRMSRLDQLSPSQTQKHSPPPSCVGTPMPLQRNVRQPCLHILWSTVGNQNSLLCKVSFVKGDYRYQVCLCAVPISMRAYTVSYEYESVLVSPHLRIRMYGLHHLHFTLLYAAVLLHTYTAVHVPHYSDCPHESIWTRDSDRHAVLAPLLFKPAVQAFLCWDACSSWSPSR